MRTICLSLALAAAVASGANPAQNIVVGRTIYHKDDSRTESVRDPNTRELTEITYDANNALTVRKVFLLNDKGEALQGNVYDGRGNLVATCRSFFDDLGRKKEDRLMNVNGEVFQQVIYEYETDGKAKKPKVINLNVAHPSIKPAAVDFTGGDGAGRMAPVSAPSGRFAPTPVERTPASQPPIYAPGIGPAAEPEKPKEGFFKRLFRKKDKSK